MTTWELHGMEFANCSCSYGCPCQFNALPTQGYCQAICFFRIDRGEFGGVRLDGLNMAIAAAWPGAIHKGQGTYQTYIDQRGNEGQRGAMLKILTGKESAPMTSFWAVYTAMSSTVHPPIYTKISIDLDLDARKAECAAEGGATGKGQPILNPVTGAEHRAGIMLPNGFEYGRSEVGRGWSTSAGSPAITLSDSHAHWCELHFNQDGRIK